MMRAVTLMSVIAAGMVGISAPATADPGESEDSGLRGLEIMTYSRDMTEHGSSVGEDADGQRRARVTQQSNSFDEKVAVFPETKGTFGLDYSFSRPSVKDMKKTGVYFVSRYLSKENRLTQPKLLTGQEALELSRNGIAIVANYEWYGDRPLEGFNAGMEDAKIAQTQAVAAGMPPTRPIYFSVDTSKASSNSVMDYFKGVASVIGLKRTGVYGSYEVVKGLRDKNLVTWTWQTYAWSKGQWDPRNNFEQYQNGSTLGTADVDYNRAITDDFGQWFHINAR